MEKRNRLLTTSVAQKFLSALTGILLCLYLVAHLAGNLLIFGGKGPFNTWGNFLNGLPFLPLVELALLGLALAHIYMGLRVWRQNKIARPDDYAMRKWTRDGKISSGAHKSRKGWTSTLMGVSGLVTLAFLVFHVWHFKYGRFIPLRPESPTTSLVTSPNGASPSRDADGIQTMNEAKHEGEGRDLAQLMLEEFKNPLVVLVYVVGMLLLGMHLNHGVSSAFQSMGVGGYGKMWMIVGRAFTFIIIGGFLTIPLWIFLFHGPVAPTAAERTAAESSTRSAAAISSGRN